MKGTSRVGIAGSAKGETCMSGQRQKKTKLPGLE